MTTLTADVLDAIKADARGADQRHGLVALTPTTVRALVHEVERLREAVGRIACDSERAALHDSSGYRARLRPACCIARKALEA